MTTPQTPTETASRVLEMDAKGPYCDPIEALQRSYFFSRQAPELARAVIKAESDLAEMRKEITSMLQRNGQFRSDVLFAIAGTREALPDEQIVATAKSVADELREMREENERLKKERDELSRTIEDAHHAAMIDWPGDEVPLLGQVESLFSALKDYYNAQLRDLRGKADGLAEDMDKVVKECYSEANRLANHGSNGLEKLVMRHLYSAANESSAKLADYRAAHGVEGK